MRDILYLHGFASSPRSKKATFLANRFAQIGARVRTPDLNEGDFRGLTLTRQLRLVQRLVEEQPPDLLIGSSLGGYTAALFAALEPRRVPALCLLAPAFGFGSRLARRLGDAELAAWQKAGERSFHHYGTDRDEPVSYQLHEDALWHDAFPSVSQPTLIFHGRHDQDVPADLSVEFAWGKPNVQLELLDSGHGLTDVLEPIWERIVTFYQGLKPKLETVPTRQT